MSDLHLQSLFNKFLVLFLIAMTFTSFGQKEYRFDFTIESLPHEKLWMIFYYGDQQIRLDTAFTDNAGHVTFKLDDSDDIGMYRLEIDKERGLDFLYNKEDVAISAENDFRLEGIKVEKSRENQVFFDYYRHKFDLENRLDILGGFLRYYPSSDTFYHTVSNHARLLSIEYQDYLDRTLTDHKDLLVARIIRFDQLPDIRPGEIDPGSQGFYRSHYFDGVDLKDSLILNTPLLPVKIIDYLSLYVQPGISREQQESLFIQAVDSLMKFSEGGGKVREMIVNYLITGFQAYGFEGVLTHLVENYVLGQSCVSDQQEEKLRIRIEGFKKLAVGSPAPDFEIPDVKGEIVKLSNLKGKMIVLMFWASNCPHCKAILPEINNLSVQYSSKAEFIGISVDEDEVSWRQAVSENQLPFINVAELQGWDGEIIQDYYVYATPTFLVIGPDGLIAAKPVGLADLQAALQK